MNHIDQPTFTPRTLEKRRVAVIGATALHSMRLDESPRPHVNALVRKLEAFVLSEKLEEGTRSHTVRVPADWWQHWKKDVAPRWLLSWLPDIQWRELTLSVDLERWATYPSASVALPEDRFGPMVVMDEAHQRFDEGVAA